MNRQTAIDQITTITRDVEANGHASERVVLLGLFRVVVVVALWVIGQDHEPRKGKKGEG